MNELDGRVHDRAISRAQRNPPHGGLLVDLLLAQDEAAVLRKHSTALPAITLDDRQLCDLELLLNGGFSPLKGFMTRADYLSVVERLRLADGTLWPMPVTLDVDAAVANGIHPGQEVVLRDSDATPLAIMTGACPRFCVNGPLAGNCHLTRRHHESTQTRRTRRTA